jgi:hypothetical protein
MPLDRAVPVIDKDGVVVLYDIWIDEVWHGSRRTWKQVREYHGQLRRTVDIARIEPRDPSELFTE